MLRLLTHHLASAPVLAQHPARWLDEAGLGAAALLTITGMVLHWQMPRHRMSMEERVKDGKITAEEAERRMRFRAICAPVATMLGVAVLVVELLNLGR
jgi:hypothetical protein